MIQPIDDALARRLVARCAERDEKALVQLHELLARRIYAFAFHRLRDEQDAETVVVDTLHEVWKSAERFRGDSLVTTWVLGIARFKGLQLRDREPPDHDDIDDHADSLAADTEDGEAALSRWQQAQQVRNCMERLSAAHRECMQLVYYEGMGLAEVALVQHVPENTVKTRLFHARNSMRECVEGSAP